MSWEDYKTPEQEIKILMDWRNEKEKQGKKIPARAIQRLIDKRMSKASIHTRNMVFIYERETGIKVNGW